MNTMRLRLVSYSICFFLCCTAGVCSSFVSFPSKQSHVTDSSVISSKVSTGACLSDVLRSVMLVNTDGKPLSHDVIAAIQSLYVIENVPSEHRKSSGPPHMERVFEYTDTIGRAMGLSTALHSVVSKAALVHDLNYLTYPTNADKEGLQQKSQSVVRKYLGISKDPTLSIVKDFLRSQPLRYWPQEGGDFFYATVECMLDLEGISDEDRAWMRQGLLIEVSHERFALESLGHYNVPVSDEIAWFILHHNHYIDVTDDTTLAEIRAIARKLSTTADEVILALDILIVADVFESFTNITRKARHNEPLTLALEKMVNDKGRKVGLMNIEAIASAVGMLLHDKQLDFLKTIFSGRNLSLNNKNDCARIQQEIVDAVAMFDDGRPAFFYQEGYVHEGQADPLPIQNQNDSTGAQSFYDESKSTNINKKLFEDLFSKVGNQTADEFCDLVDDVRDVLAQEQKTGMLRAKIQEIESTDYFTEGGVAYIPDGEGALFVVGDTHGDFSTLKQIIIESQMLEKLVAGEPCHVVFLGDYTDIGVHVLECLEVVMLLKRRFPEQVSLLTGNHEQRTNIRREVTLHEKAGKVDGDFYVAYEHTEFPLRFKKREFSAVRLSLKSFFADLPFQAVTKNGIVFVHGAAPSAALMEKFHVDENGLLAVAGNKNIRNKMLWGFVQRREELEDRPLGIKGSQHSWIGWKSFVRYMDAIGGSIMVRGHDRAALWDHALFDNRFISIISTDFRSADYGYTKTPEPILGRYGVFDLGKTYGSIKPEEVISLLVWKTKNSATGDDDSRVLDERFAYNQNLIQEVSEQLLTERRTDAVPDTCKTVKDLYALGIQESFIQNNIIFIPPQDASIVVVGDNHGDRQSLLRILDASQFESRIEAGENIYLVCLGDYIDRGERSLEVMEILLQLKKRYRDKVVLLRGNHDNVDLTPRDDVTISSDEIASVRRAYPVETRKMTDDDIMSFLLESFRVDHPEDYEPEWGERKFPKDLRDLFGDNRGKLLFQQYKRLFETFPVGLFFGQNMLFVHGTVPHESIVMKNGIGALCRKDNGMLCDQMRGDYIDSRNKQKETLKAFENHPYFAIQSQDFVARSLDALGVQWMVRGHDGSLGPHHRLANGRVVTVHSCGGGSSDARSDDQYDPVRYLEISFDKEKGGDILPTNIVTLDDARRECLKKTIQQQRGPVEILQAVRTWLLNAMFFNDLKSNSEYRYMHMLRVIEYCDAFLRRDFEYFTNKLREKLTPKEREAYLSRLNILWRAFDALPYDEQIAFVIALSLHDISFAEDIDPVNHEYKSGIVAMKILAHEGLSDIVSAKQLALIKQIISTHTLLGCMRYGERVPRAFVTQGNNILFYILMNICDVAGMGSGNVNRVDPVQLEDIMRFLDQTALHELVGVYDQHRLVDQVAIDFAGDCEYFLRQAQAAKEQRKDKNERQKIVNAIAHEFGEFNVEKKDETRLRAIMRTRLDIVSTTVAIPFVVSLNDHEYRRYAKCMRFIAQCADVLDEMLPGDRKNDDTILCFSSDFQELTESDLGYPAVYQGVYRFFPQLIDNIPDDHAVTRKAIERFFAELKEQDKGTIGVLFGIPMQLIDDTHFAFSVERFVRLNISAEKTFMEAA